MNRWSPFEWITAIRFLKEGRMQTAFIVVAVAIGVAVIVFMSAMLSSMEANFMKRMLTAQPHIQLVPPEEVARPLLSTDFGVASGAVVQQPAQRIRSIDQWQTIVAELRGWPEIATVAPTITASALATKGEATRPVSVVGIDPAVYFNIVHVPEFIVSGQPRLQADDILIGIELAKDLGVALGDKINVTGGSGATQILTIAGLFDLGNRGANARTTYVSLRTGQALSNLVGGVTTIDVTVNDIYAAETIAQAIHAATGIEADSWIATNAQFFTAISAQQSSNTMIRVFVGLSIVFGIASVLVVSVIQRSRDIGILRAVGTTRGQILRVFLLQGGLLGFLGSLAGAAAGGLGVAVWHATMRQANGAELFPLVMENSLFVIAVLLASATGVIAATVPALRAAKLDPVVAIRG
ncbi:MAG: ABC transporter permease [Rhodospirillaceae bacterium]